MRGRLVGGGGERTGEHSPGLRLEGLRDGVHGVLELIPLVPAHWAHPARGAGEALEDLILFTPPKGGKALRSLNVCVSVCLCDTRIRCSAAERAPKIGLFSHTGGFSLYSRLCEVSRRKSVRVRADRESLCGVGRPGKKTTGKTKQKHQAPAEPAPLDEERATRSLSGLSSLHQRGE